MTTTTTDELVVKLSLNAANLQAGLLKTEQAISSFTSKMETVIGGALTVIGIKFSATFAKDLVETFANTGAKLYYLSQKIGDNAGQLDKWSAAASKAGGSASSFLNTVENLKTKLVNAKFAGDPKMLGILSMLGVSPTDVNGKLKTSTKLLTDLADKFKGMNGDQRQYIGSQLGLDDATIRLISKGREETLKFVNAQAEIWTPEKAEKAAKFQQRLIDTNRKIEELKVNIGEKLLPIAYRFTDWMAAFIDKYGVQIANTFEKITIFIAQLATDYLPKLIQMLNEFKDITGLTNNDLVNLLTGLLLLKGATTVFDVLTKGAKTFLLELLPIVGALKTVKLAYDAWQSKDDPKKTRKIFKAFGGEFGEKVYDKMATVGSQWYDSFGDDYDPNSTKITPQQYDSVITKLAPAIAQIESSGGTNIDSGNGAYGAYQVRPRWGNAAWKKAGGQEHSKEWYLNPENSFATYKLMMRQNLEEHKGDVNAAIKEYSGGNYAYNEVFKQAATLKLNDINTKLIGLKSSDIIPNNTSLAMNNGPSPNQLNQPTIINNQQSNNNKNTQQTSNTKNAQQVTIGSMTVVADNPDQFFNKMSKIGMAVPFSNGRGV